MALLRELLPSTRIFRLTNQVKQYLHYQINTPNMVISNVSILRKVFTNTFTARLLEVTPSVFSDGELKMELLTGSLPTAGTRTGETTVTSRSCVVRITVELKVKSPPDFPSNKQVIIIMLSAYSQSHFRVPLFFLFVPLKTIFYLFLFREVVCTATE